MWSRNLSLGLLQCSQPLIENRRTTFILRRTKGIRLSKLRAPVQRKLKQQQFYYELVEDTKNKKKPQLDLILVKDVPGIGMIGENIKANFYSGYMNFLLPKLAVYANSAEAKTIKRTEDDIPLSSIYSKIIKVSLAERPLPIFMNEKTEWILQPWHVKTALRRIGIIIQDKCVKLPKKEISGPNLSVENKDFIIKLVLNNQESFPVRCRIFHWKKDETDIKFIEKEILHLRTESLFPEDEEEISLLLKTEQELKEASIIRCQYKT